MKSEGENMRVERKETITVTFDIVGMPVSTALALERISAAIDKDKEGLFQPEDQDRLRLLIEAIGPAFRGDIQDSGVAFQFDTTVRGTRMDVGYRKADQGASGDAISLGESVSSREGGPNDL